MQYALWDMEMHVINLVRDVVRGHSSMQRPNFNKICSDLGLDVKEVELSTEIDGLLVGRTILINSQIQNEDRKQFTRFHEVMHHLFNEDKELGSILRRATFNQQDEHDRQLERLCNIGAAEFLMPSAEFTKFYRENEFSVRLILVASRHFGSSAVATTIQLAQVAPNSCITAICEYGVIPNSLPPPQNYLLDRKYLTPKPTLHVVYSASSPTTKYRLARYTKIPNHHLIHQAFSRTQALDGESYVPFRSGKKMYCYCEAWPNRDRVYVLFHLTPLPNPNQLTLI